MLLAALVLSTQQFQIPELGVLVFSKTAGFRHASIEDGKKMLQGLARERAWMMEQTEDADALIKALPRYKVVVFLSTTGDVLNDEQQKAFEAWFKQGNGYVGIHAAADTEYDWPWYGKLVGAWFKSHPAIQKADIVIEDGTNKIVNHLPSTWSRSDEWYDYRANPRRDVKVLARLDSTSYDGSSMVGDHPIVWYHEFDGGRAFYSGLGHTAESYTEKNFTEMIRKAVEWAGKKL